MNKDVPFTDVQWTRSRELNIRVSRNYHLPLHLLFPCLLSPIHFLFAFTVPAFFSFPSPDEGVACAEKKGEGRRLLFRAGKRQREREREREREKRKKKEGRKGGKKKWKSFVEKRRAGPRWLSESFFKMSATASRGEVGGWSGGWLEGSEHGRTGGCAGGRSGWSTPVAKGGKMAAHGKSMEASHCRRPRFHNPQTHPPVPPPHRQPLCNPPHFRASRKRPHPGHPCLCSSKNHYAPMTYTSCREKWKNSLFPFFFLFFSFLFFFFFLLFFPRWGKKNVISRSRNAERNSFSFLSFFFFFLLNRFWIVEIVFGMFIFEDYSVL